MAAYLAYNSQRQEPYTLCITEITYLIIILLYLIHMVLPYLFAEFIIKFTWRIVTKAWSELYSPEDV